MPPKMGVKECRGAPLTPPHSPPRVGAGVQRGVEHPCCTPSCQEPPLFLPASLSLHIPPSGNTRVVRTAVPAHTRCSVHGGVSTHLQGHTWLTPSGSPWIWPGPPGHLGQGRESPSFPGASKNDSGISDAPVAEQARGAAGNCGGEGRWRWHISERQRLTRPPQ